MPATARPHDHSRLAGAQQRPVETWTKDGRMTTQITVERLVEAPKDVIWRALTDMDEARTVRTGVRKLEAITSGPYQVGTRWRESRSALPGQTEEMEVVEVDEPQWTAIASQTHGEKRTTTVAIDECDQHVTLLRVQTSVTRLAHDGVVGAIQRFAARTGARYTSRALEKDLADISVAAERLV